jgi:hypothetical protein
MGCKSSCSHLFAHYGVWRYFEFCAVGGRCPPYAVRFIHSKGFALIEPVGYIVGFLNQIRVVTEYLHAK